MLVADILRDKGSAVVTVTPEVTVDEVVGLMALHGVGALVVSSDGSHVEGLVNERDVVLALAAQGREALAWTAGDICRASTPTRPGDPIERVMGVMTERRLRHLPVVVDGELRGIVSIGDVVKSRLAELEQEREVLADYISRAR